VGKVSQHPLNGLMLYTLVLVDADVAEPWVRVERIALWSMVGLLMFIVVLLTWLLIRRLQGNERIRQHAKRSRSLERKLTKTIGERDVLNREVHHRVKNNLQVVSSLLNLQASRLENGPVREEFLRGKRRIDTIALVHHKMYDLKDLRNVDLQQFFNQLITSLAVMHLPNSRTVSHELKAGGIKADQDTAIELGIILCELVTNTYQHAFPYATGGHVDILVQPVESDLHRLIVKDNGRGLPANYNNGEGKLGLEIVDALAEQLNGSFHVRTEGGGVTFEVLFRMKWNTSAGDIIDPQGAE
jgi:two-component sensor histidine kinase